MLAWLVAGYVEWRAHGLAEPAAVTAATAAYRAESDAVTRFLADRCLIGPHFTARSSDLYAAYRQWCDGEGEQAGTAKAFAIALQSRGHDNRRSRIGAVWSGVGLAAGDDE